MQIKDRQANRRIGQWTRRFGVLLLLVSPWAYAHDPNDFAVEVIAYDPGMGVGSDLISGASFTNASVALGRPTIDTTGNGWEIHPAEHVPVVPVFPPYRATEIVTIGTGGHLILKMGRPVYDDPRHPYGIDLLIFGNTLQAQTGQGGTWINRSPETVTLQATVFEEPGPVSVSQDGVNWYTFTNGPYADTFAPTLGRQFRPDAPDTSLGEWNVWWGAPTDPTFPLDPAIAASNLAGRTVAEVAQIYGASAGGTGFDIGQLPLPIDPETGLKWIRYVRIEAGDSPGITPEIDAVAAVRPVSDYALWRIDQFTWEELADEAISGDTATDAQGVPHRLRYALGADLQSPGAPLYHFAPTDNGTRLQLSYLQRRQQSALNLSFEWSGDLHSWHALSGEPVTLTVTPLDDELERVDATYPWPSNWAALRLRGTVPNDE